MQTVHQLYLNLPEACIFVLAETEDSQLIIETMRAGAREFLSQPVKASAISDAIHRYLAEKRTNEESKTSGEIFSVLGTKGGVGATTTAVNLAASLTDDPQAKVALLDLNDQLGDLAVHLNLKTEFTVADAVASISRLDAVLLDSFMTHSQGVAVLAGRKDLESSPPSEQRAITHLLEVTSEVYSHIFVDLSPFGKENELRPVLEMSRSILLVLTPDLAAVWGGQRVLDLILRWVEPEKVRLILNRSQLTDEVVAEDVEKALELPVFWNLPNNYNGVVKAINSGVPVVLRHDSDLSRKYRDLAAKLTGLALSRKKKRFFGLLSS